MRGKEDPSWGNVVLVSGQLAVDAAWVVWLRSLRLLGGGEDARNEACLMVTEKVDAQVELAAKLAKGDLGRAPVELVNGSLSHYARYVRGNRRRLSRGR